MRIIEAETIIQAVKKMAIQANCVLEDKIICHLMDDVKKETNEKAIFTLNQIIENDILARKDLIPICQDTGIAVVFLDMGMDCHVNGNVYEAINEGIRLGYKDGFLRKSVVENPLTRLNTQDNTPAIIHTNLVSGDKIRIVFAPKGAGSENMSRLKMLKPADGLKGIEDFVIETVKLAGGKPCPPIIVGVGIGGNFEKCAQLAKEALITDIDKINDDEKLAALERMWLEKINNLDIGPMGLGGKTTALAVKIKTYACHIASLPVAVNIQCHVSRHGEVIL